MHQTHTSEATKLKTQLADTSTVRLCRAHTEFELSIVALVLCLCLLCGALAMLFLGDTYSHVGGKRDPETVC